MGKDREELLGRGRGPRSVEQRLEDVLDLAHLVRSVLEIVAAAAGMCGHDRRGVERLRVQARGVPVDLGPLAVATILACPGGVQPALAPTWIV